MSSMNLLCDRQLVNYHLVNSRALPESDSMNIA
jgi:hypothetical protein